MNKVRSPLVRRSLVKVLSLGVMVLGIGCIAWAMFSIRVQSGYSAGAILSQYFRPTALAAEVNRVRGDETAPLVPLSETSKTLYPEYPVEGDHLGSLTIPALERMLPVFQGTGEKELKKGVGHFNLSVLPGEADNCVLSGHRETVFRQLDKLKLGDQLIVETVAGTFTYEVTGTRIVQADDKTVIVPTDSAVLTLTTCYPFNTPGYFPERYIVSADLVKSDYSIISTQ